MSANVTGTAQELVIAPLTIEPSDIAQFISNAYDQHPHGSAFVPRWSGAALKHMIFDHPDFTPDHALGAYRGEELVGLIMSQPYAVQLNGKTLKGIYGSWLAIPPDGADQFTAIKLVGGLKERLTKRGAAFMVGVAYRSGARVGLDFWEGYHQAFPNEISPGRDLKYWARVLDGAALARAVNDPLIKLGGYVGRLRAVRKPKGSDCVRAFAAGDLEKCQELMSRAPARLRTAPSLWELQSAPTLDQGPQTLVLDKGRGVEGFSTFHILPMSDAGPLGIGMIDHLVCLKSHVDQSLLLAAVLWRLKSAGACLTLLPRKPYISGWPLLLSGFAPYAADFKMFFMPFREDLAAEMPASYDLLVR